MAPKDRYISIRVDPELLAKIDALREDRSRAQWCRRAIDVVIARQGQPPTGASGPKAAPITKNAGGRS